MAPYVAPAAMMFPPLSTATPLALSQAGEPNWRIQVAPGTGVSESAGPGVGVGVCMGVGVCVGDTVAVAVGEAVGVGV